MRAAAWSDAGQGWQGAETPLRLSGWRRARRAVVLRRRVQKDLAVADKSDPQELRRGERWGQRLRIPRAVNLAP
jgi:hypothetical protein